MSKFQMKDLEVDLRQTPLENLFLDTYLPLANEVQLKVYLYGFRLAFQNREFEEGDLAKFLAFSEREIEDAFKFWEDLGLIKIENDGSFKSYIFKSVRFLYLGIDNEFEGEDNKAKRENVGSENKDIPRDNFEVDIDELNEMYKIIEEYISMDQPMYISLDPKDIRILNDLVYDFKLDPNFVAYAYHLASEINEFKSKNPPYVTKVIERWVKYENIRSIDQLDKYIEKRSKVEEEKKEKKNREYKKKKENRPKNVYKDDRLSKSERRSLIKKKLREQRQ